jgi:hypothetical protein
MIQYEHSWKYDPIWNIYELTLRSKISVYEETVSKVDPSLLQKLRKIRLRED